MADRIADVQPVELAAVLDLVERPRVGGWSLRSALTRYAQPEPRRVSELLDLVRRIEVVLPGLVEVAAQYGPALWAAATSDATPVHSAAGGDDLSPFAVGLLQTMIEIDHLADTLATWADQWSLDRPNAAMDEVTEHVRAKLEALGVPEQERPAPPRGRARS